MRQARIKEDVMTVRFGELLEKIAHVAGDSPAVTFEGRTRTWREVYVRCRNVAAGLEQHGLKPGERVAYLGFNSDALFECYFAPSMAGLETVVLNFRWSARECAHALQECTPRVLVFDPAHAGLAAQAAAESGQAPLLVEVGDRARAPTIAYEALATRAGTPGTHGSSDDDTLIIYFTGGTTGRSKGVMLSHWNLFTNAMGAPHIMGNERDSAQLVVGPMFHLAPGSRIFSAVLLNIHSVIMPRFDVVETMALIERHRIHSLTLVPTMMHMILTHPEFHRFNLSSVGQITLGGAATPRDLLEKVIAAFPSARLNNGYGMTEMSPMLAALTSEHHVLSGPKAGKLNSVGRPVPYLDIRIFGENDRELPQGEIGEIVARGPTVMKGYLNRPDENAVALRGGWFHTGDMGYFDKDGLLYISGRSKDMIISGGENIYPTEIEDVISTHPAVSQVAVIGLPSEKWGEEVHAVIILAEGKAAGADDIVAHCRAQLAGYKCPRGITFRREAMPLSPANKILKSELRKQVLAGLPRP
jgi:acyl-CoA synthetase (AMP-forming)/AMP-acid ligase II